MMGEEEKELSPITRTLHWEPAGWLVKASHETWDGTSIGQDHVGSMEGTSSQGKGSHELRFCKVRDGA